MSDKRRILLTITGIAVVAFAALVLASLYTSVWNPIQGEIAPTEAMLAEDVQTAATESASGEEEATPESTAAPQDDEAVTETPEADEAETSGQANGSSAEATETPPQVDEGEDEAAEASDDEADQVSDQPDEEIEDTEDDAPAGEPTPTSRSRSLTTIEIGAQPVTPVLEGVPGHSAPDTGDSDNAGATPTSRSRTTTSILIGTQVAPDVEGVPETGQQ